MEPFNYGDYVVYPPNEYADCAQWQIFKPGGERLTGALHKTIKDKIKSKLKREKKMLPDCCSVPCPPKAYACKVTPPAYTPVCINAQTYSDLQPTISLDTLAYAQQCLSKASIPMTYVGVGGIMPNKKDEQMFNSTSDLEIQQRNFLKARANELEMTKRQDLRKTFNIDYTFRPKTKDEFLEALKSATIDDTYGSYFGKDGSNKFEYDYRSLLGAVKLTDGKTVVDRPAYDAAKVKLADALRDLKDTITVSPLTEAVAAFEVFKKATFH